MSGRDTRDRQVLTLLVQLFGRDVMDRLAGAGFDAPAAMARAGAERLAADAGIPIAIARRIAIVVEESPGPGAAARTEPAARPEAVARKEPAPRLDSAARSNSVERDESEMLMDPATPSEPAAREERRPAKPAPRKRGEPRTEVVSATPPAPTVPPPTAAPAEPASPAAQATASGGRNAFLDDGDPFVDDVALVSWMGLNSHQPDGRLAFTVSDTILDPAEAEGTPPVGRGAAEHAAPGDRDARRPRPSGAAPVELPVRPAVLSGSFWTFGRPADPTPSPTSRKAEPQSAADTPRRRKHDGH